MPRQNKARTLAPFGLSLSKPCPSTSDIQERQGFDKLSPNGHVDDGGGSPKPAATSATSQLGACAGMTAKV
jgi:hypothetical protein